MADRVSPPVRQAKRAASALNAGGEPVGTAGAMETKAAQAEDDDIAGGYVADLVGKATRRESNYSAKQRTLFRDAPSQNLYAMEVAERVAPSRRDISFSHVADLRSDGKQPEFASNEDAAQAADQIAERPQAPSAEQTADRKQRVEKSSGAKRLVGPKLVPIQTMSSFFEKNLPALILSGRRNAERPLSAPPAVAPVGAAVAPRSSRATIGGGKRARTMQADGKSAASDDEGEEGGGGAEAVSASPALPTLSPDDPAFNTIDRIELVTAMLVPFLEQCRRYTDAKARYDKPHKLCDPYVVDGFLSQRFFFHAI